MINDIHTFVIDRDNVAARAVSHLDFDGGLERDATCSISGFQFLISNTKGTNMQTVGRRLVAAVLIFLAAGVLISCGSSEEKKKDFFDKGMTLFDEGAHVKAKLEFKNAIQIDPKFGRAYYMLGMVALKEKNYKGAFGRFSKAAELTPDDVDVHVQLGKLFLSAKQFDNAREKVEFVLERDPENTETLMLKALVLLTEGKPGEAIVILDGLLQKGLGGNDVYLMLASSYSKQNLADKTEETLRKGIEQNPESTTLLLALAEFLLKTKRPDDSLALLKRVVELEPDKPEHKFVLARLYWDTGRKDDAEALLADVVGTDSANEKTWLRLAGFYLSKKLFDKAEQSLTDGIARHPGSFNLRFMLSDAYMNQRRNDEAFAVLEECLGLEDGKATPDILKTKNAIARLHLKLGDLEKARANVDEVLEASPKNIDAHVTGGSIHLLLGDGLSAVSEFMMVVDERPNFIPAYIRLADAHMLNKEPELAVGVLRQALKVRPDSRAVSRALTRLYIMKKDHEAAEKIMKDHLQENPADLFIRADLGDFYFMKGDFDGAKREYEIIVNTPTNNAIGYLKLGRLYVRQNKMEEAISLMKKGCEFNPDCPYLFASLVELYTNTGQHDAAVRACEERIEATPGDAFLYNLVGKVHGSRKAYPKAREAFQKAMDINPLWPEPHQNLARILMAEGKVDDAIDKFKAKIAAAPDNATLHLTLALLYEHTRQYDKAIDVYTRSLEVEPDLWIAANNMAVLLSEHGDAKADLEKALSLAKMAQKHRPGAPDILDTLGWIYYKMGDYERALGFMEKAYSGAPENPILNYHLGMTLVKNDRTNDAREVLKKTLKLSGDFPGREDVEKALDALN